MEEYCATNGEVAGCEALTPATTVEPTEPEIAICCCRAMMASCLACAAGVTVEEYCEQNTEVLGCPEPSCFQSGYRYMPLDMRGHGRTEESTAEQCQARCAATFGCAYFSYWADGGCHLQDSSAVPEEWAAATSGPATCGQESPTCSGPTHNFLMPDGRTVPMCTKPSSPDDGNTQPWVLFGDIDSAKDNFNGPDAANSETHSGLNTHNSVQIGTFSAGRIGSPGYSLDIQNLARYSGETFDLMIQIGGDDPDVYVVTGLTKTGTSFINNRHTRDGPVIGEHGMFGSRDSPDSSGLYATYCAFNGGCGHHGYDFFSFSTHGVYPRGADDIICGWYYGGPVPQWKDCPNGDNVHRMKYYIRMSEHPIRLEASCYHTGLQYAPLDMPGTARTEEEDALACQQRCSETPGCAHFSYWSDGGCHLQDGAARPEELPDEGYTAVTSGPPDCTEARFEVAMPDMKCPHDHADRLFRAEGQTLETCAQMCIQTQHCRHFSFATSGTHPQVCVGCTSLRDAEEHEGFDSYHLLIPNVVPEPPIPPVSIVPTQNCPNPNGRFKICSAWGDPHFTHLFFQDNQRHTHGMQGGLYQQVLQHHKVGAFRLASNFDKTFEVQAFFCHADQWRVTTSVNALAIRQGDTTVTFLRNPRTRGNLEYVPAVGAQNTDIYSFIPGQGNAAGSTDIKVNGQPVSWDSLGNGVGGGTFRGSGSHATNAPNQGEEYNGEVWMQQLIPTDRHDRTLAPVCLGDAGRSATVSWSLPHFPRVYEPIIAIYMAEHLISEEGICGDPSYANSDAMLMTDEDFLFSLEDVEQICDVCGLQRGIHGCEPETDTDPGANLEQLCEREGVDMFTAQQACDEVADGEAWLEACVQEYCAEGGQDAEEIVAFLRQMEQIWANQGEECTVSLETTRVNIGSSGHNTKCVTQDYAVSCQANAGDPGIRSNLDYATAGDRFEITVNGNQVCARRLDASHGWGMQLAIDCRLVQDAAVNLDPSEFEVQIGSSGPNRRCVNHPVPVQCNQNAGNRGVRINNDYANAGDRFDIQVENGGRRVCARRLDAGHGWGMQLRLQCSAAR